MKPARSDNSSPPNKKALTWRVRFVVAITSRVCGAGAVILLHLILARTLGAAAYGEFAYVLAWVTALSVPALMGMDNATLRLVSRYYSKGDHAKLNGFLRSSLKYILVGSFLCAGGMLGIAWMKGDQRTSAMFCVFCFGAMVLPLQTTLRSREASLLAMGATATGVVSSWLVPTLSLIVVVSCYWLLGSETLSSSNAMAIHLFSVSIAAICALYFVSRRTLRKGLPVRRISSRVMWGVGGPLMLLGVAMAVKQHCSLLLVGGLLGTEEVGCFAIALRLAALQTFGIDAINTVVAPQFAALHARRDQVGLQRAARLSAWVSTTFAAAVFLALLVAGSGILGWFGPSFEASYPAFVILAVGAVVNASCGSVGYLLNMTGSHNICLRVAIINGIAHFVIACFLVPWLGIVGAALAHTISTITWNLTLAYFVRRRLGIWSCISVPVTKINEIPTAEEVNHLLPLRSPETIRRKSA